jgi:hypothetical protein
MFRSLPMVVVSVITLSACQTPVPNYVPPDSGATAQIRFATTQVNVEVRREERTDCNGGGGARIALLGPTSLIESNSNVGKKVGVPLSALGPTGQQFKVLTLTIKPEIKENQVMETLIPAGGPIAISFKSTQDIGISRSHCGLKFTFDVEDAQKYEALFLSEPQICYVQVFKIVPDGDSYRRVKEPSVRIIKEACN